MTQAETTQESPWHVCIGRDAKTGNRCSQQVTHRTPDGLYTCRRHAQDDCTRISTEDYTMRILEDHRRDDKSPYPVPKSRLYDRLIDEGLDDEKIQQTVQSLYLTGRIYPAKTGWAITRPRDEEDDAP